MAMKNILVIITACLLSSCTVPKRDMQEIDHINLDETYNNQYYEEITPIEPSQAILDSLKETPSEREKQDISAIDTPMNKFLLACAERYKTNITIEASLVQPVTLRLQQVSLVDIFEYISKIEKIDYERNKSGWIIKPAQVSTQIYSIDSINIIRFGQSSTIVPRASNNLNQITDASSNSDKKLDSDSISLSSKFDNSQQWIELQNTLNSLRQAPNQESITINTNTGSISVTAYKNTHKIIDKFIKHLNYKLAQQVMIEAKILEVALNDEYQSGVNLSGISLSYNSVDGSFKYYTSATSFNNILALLKQQGKVNVLSSPKVSVSNQQRAIIKVGNDSYYATGTLQTSSSTDTSNQINNLVEYQPFFSGLVLDVTAHINDSQEIFMHVHPYISVVTPDLLNMPLQNTVTGDLIPNAFLRMASTQIRETDTIIKAKSGELIVIAGLMTRGYNSLHNTPGNVNIVTASKDSYQNTEIVILIKPILMNSSKWKKLLATSKNNTAVWSR